MHAECVHQAKNCTARKDTSPADSVLCAHLYVSVQCTWRQAPGSADMRLSEEGP